MKSSKVEILVSTYNGEKYLVQQLDSLLAQSYRDIAIKVRDDGSSDSTKQVLRQYEKDHSCLEVIQGDNVGVIGSFFDLLYCISDDSEFVAFCDQDDVWHRDKIAAAVSKLISLESHKPSMYCCRTRLVNNDLEVIGYGGIPKRALALENALIQNVATGCTIVLNRRAADLLRAKRPNLRCILMHDFWFYLVLSSLGRVYFDENAYIDYRQHDGNVIGAKQGLGFLHERFKRFFKGGTSKLPDQCREFLRVYSDELSDEKKRVIQAFLDSACADSALIRLYLAFKAKTYRQSSVDTFLSRVLLVIGKYR